MLSAAWKPLGGKTECIAVKPKDVFNDKEVVRAYHDALSDADVWIGHNFKAFDIKKFNTRAIYHKLKPIAPKPIIDTLKSARRHFKFPSDKLAYLAVFLGLDAKDESPNWLKVMQGDEREIKHMVKYNKQDCVTTEQVYLRMLPWMDDHPNMNVLQPAKDIADQKLPQCRNCASVNLVKNGKRYAPTGITQRVTCKDCGHHNWMDGKGNVK
jgi:hypothetical protein